MNSNTLQRLFSRKLIFYSQGCGTLFAYISTLVSCLLFLSMLFFAPSLFAAEAKVVNVYDWGGEIPDNIIAQFEKETGITVNMTSYDSNEIMYAKLRASKNSQFDIVEPSSYYVDRMRHEDMLEKLDKAKLSNFKNIDPLFVNQAYDPHSSYSIPFVWGVTGVFVNQDYLKKAEINNWSDLFNKKYLNQLMLLDDPREVFSMALLTLGYSINDTNPEHIKQAYFKLRELMPNVRLFNVDAVVSILIDEDATVGLSWNGDLYKASVENSKLRFIYPKNGFEIWVDNFVLLKNSKNKDNAYQFLNFLMRPDIAKAVSLNINYSTANLAAKKLLPPEVKNNSVLYPLDSVLKHGEFETDIGDKTFALYEKYWEKLKMSA